MMKTNVEFLLEYKRVKIIIHAILWKLIIFGKKLDGRDGSSSEYFNEVWTSAQKMQLILV